MYDIKHAFQRHRALVIVVDVCESLGQVRHHVQGIRIAKHEQPLVSFLAKRDKRVAVLVQAGEILGKPFINRASWLPFFGIDFYLGQLLLHA